MDGANLSGFFFFGFIFCWARDSRGKRNGGLPPLLRVFVCVGICLGDEARYCIADISFGIIFKALTGKTRGEEVKR